MKVLSVSTILFLCLVGFSQAGVMAKHLPTTKALQDRLTAVENGFTGAQESFTSRPDFNQDIWNNVVAQHLDQMRQVQQLYKEITVILQYYDLTGGTEEAAKYFDRWLIDLKLKSDQLLADVCSQYENAANKVLPTN